MIIRPQWLRLEYIIFSSLVHFTEISWWSDDIKWYKLIYNVLKFRAISLLFLHIVLTAVRPSFAQSLPII